MDANKVDHLLRAAGNATNQKQFVLIGSAAIFAWRQVVPPEMAMTREIDLFAYDTDPETAKRIADEIDGSLGQASQFDATYGYYCDGVEPRTAILPLDWRTRAKHYSNENTDGVTAIVPSPNDIAVSKLCAGRPKDVDWLVAAVRHHMVDPDQMRLLFGRLPEDRPGIGLEVLEERLASVLGRG